MNAWTKYSNNNMIKGSKFQDDTVVMGHSLRSLDNANTNEGVNEVSEHNWTSMNETKPKQPKYYSLHRGLI